MLAPVQGAAAPAGGRSRKEEEEQMSRLLSRRTLAGTGATLAAGLALAACGAAREGAAGPGAERRAPVRLTYVRHNSTNEAGAGRHLPPGNGRKPHAAP